MNPTCPICGCPTLIADVNGRLIVCKCMQVTLTTYSSNTTASLSTYDWNGQLNTMRNWKVTLQIGGEQKQPVPQAFQDAFQDGELEL